MAQNWLPLHPFAAEPRLAAIQLEARARWHHPQLVLELRLRDPEALVLFPAAVAAGERRDGLWQATCFEAFFAEPGAEGYWELNLAPNGHWNAYRLRGYRMGLEPERAISGLPHTLRRSADGLELRLSLNLQALLPQQCDLDLSVTSVLAHSNGPCSYWALRHSASEPDFHRLESFLHLPSRP